MLKVENLTVGYSKEKIILNQLNLEIKKGEVYGILGMNGAGKTTLFKTIYGFLSHDSGDINWNNQPLSKNHLSFLETDNFFYSYMRGEEYLNILTDKNFNRNLNEIFDLPLNELIDGYSTGMKKRLAFWGIIELDKDLVILDEPFNGVDIESVECFYILIEKMKNEGKTIIISSHIIESLTRTCDKVGYLKEGNIQRIYHKEEFKELQKDIQNLIVKKVEGVFK